MKDGGWGGGVQKSFSRKLSRTLIFQTNSESLKYRRFTPSGYKEIGIKKKDL